MNEEELKKQRKEKIKKIIKIVFAITNIICIISLIWVLRDLVTDTFKLLDETNGDFFLVLKLILEKYAI